MISKPLEEECTDEVDFSLRVGLYLLLLHSAHPMLSVRTTIDDPNTDPVPNAIQSFPPTAPRYLMTRI